MFFYPDREQGYLFLFIETYGSDYFRYVQITQNSVVHHHVPDFLLVVSAKTSRLTEFVMDSYWKCLF